MDAPHSNDRFYAKIARTAKLLTTSGQTIMRCSDRKVAEVSQHHHDHRECDDAEDDAAEDRKIWGIRLSHRCQ